VEGPLVAAAGGCGGWIGERREEGDCVLKDNAEACLAAGRRPRTQRLAEISPSFVGRRALRQAHATA